MSEHDWLAALFEEHRDHLSAVAYRILGSHADADDALQEAWLRLSRSDPSRVENMGGWLTTIVSRICLNMLKARKARREAVTPEYESDPVDIDPHVGGPEYEAVQADSVGVAMLVVLDSLTPAERLAFVLHDMFAMPFDEIAPIVDRSPAATRQLASRARRRVQGRGPSGEADPARHRQIVDAFLTASRGGDFDALLELLDPAVVVRADAATVRTGAEPEVVGAPDVARTFCGRAQAARAAQLDGTPGAVWMHRGDVRIAFRFAIADERIVGIEMLSDPDRLASMEVQID